MKELEAQISHTSNFLTSIWGILTIAGTIVAGTIGGYWWLQDSLVERNAKIISEAAIAEIKAEIDPLSTTRYREDRRRDSIERINAEAIALRYMNRSDSTDMVLMDNKGQLDLLGKQLSRIELMMETDTMGELNEVLARFWEHLKAQEKSMDKLQNATEQMEKFNQDNERRIQNIKSGDRAR